MNENRFNIMPVARNGISSPALSGTSRLARPFLAAVIATILSAAMLMLSQPLTSPRSLNL